jgi:exodeoxyribonuclease VII large subunit
MMDEKLTLTELQLIIRDSLYMALPDMYWVKAEISEINENYAGHCYMELIEKNNDDKNVRARIKAIIWCKKYRFLGSLFQNSTGESLRAGIKVLVRVKIEYHELYGLSLIVCDIDPAYTMGELALKRQLIIKRLESEGVFTMNKEMQLPFSLQRIAIISSRTAAGYADFVNHLNTNSFHYVFYTKLFESPMQGEDTESGIISALDNIAAHSDMFDIVVIIRGGGSQIDLSWFDNYSIAYHITQFPIPVITGIGHEKDMSVTDMVAHLALKTPTAVADFIIERMVEVENRMMEVWNSIRDHARIIVERNKHLVESSAMKLMQQSGIMISGARLIPAGQGQRLCSATKIAIYNKQRLLENSGKNLNAVIRNYLMRKKSDFLNLEKTLDLMNPENVLKRGYTITSLNGKIVKSAREIKVDDVIDTTFADGKTRSKVIKQE